MKMSVNIMIASLGPLLAISLAACGTDISNPPGTIGTGGAPTTTTGTGATGGVPACSTVPAPVMATRLGDSATVGRAAAVADDGKVVVIGESDWIRTFGSDKNSTAGMSVILDGAGNAIIAGRTDRPSISAAGAGS